MKEIVLCSNQEIPTNMPNVENEIINFAKLKTQAPITIFSLSRFEEELSNNPNKYTAVIKRHLPEFNQYLESNLTKSRVNASEIILDVYKQRSAPLDMIEDIVQTIISKNTEEISPHELALEITSTIKSRFQRTELPGIQLVQRLHGSEYFNGSLLSQLVSIVGVHKIGKTSWVSQICNELGKLEIEILWFDAPTAENEHTEFYRDLSRILLGKLINPRVGNEFSEKKLSLSDLSKYLSNSQASTNLLLIIDNFEELLISKPIVEEIDNLLGVIKKSPVGVCIGALFIGVKSLKNTVLHLDKELSCPPWSDDELVQLLKISNIEIKDNLEDYCKLLPGWCGGHPLIALAIARRAPSISSLLLLNKPDTVPALYDEDLTAEVKTFLFEDLLSDNDLRDFVLRLSSLIYRHDLSLLNCIATGINPQLRTPTRLMLERLMGTVIEGEESSGYQVAFVFRNLAIQYVNPEQRKEIFDKVSSSLLTPKDKVIDIVKAIEGIIYALLSNNLSRAFLWTMILLNPENRKKVTKGQIKYLLDRLTIIEFLNFPDDLNSKINYSFALLSMAVTYTESGEHQHSRELIYKILKEEIDDKEIPENFPIPLGTFYNFVRMYLILILAKIEEIDEALRMVSSLNPNALSDVLTKGLDILELVSLLVQKGKAENFPTDFLYKCFKNITVDENNENLAHLVLCFQNLGVTVSRQNLQSDIEKILDIGDNPIIPLWTLLKRITGAQVELEGGNLEKCIEIVDEITSEINQLDIRSRILKTRLLLMKGDALFKLGNYEKAKVKYQKSLNLLPKDTNTFDHAWSSYRLGLCTTDNAEAIDNLSKAIKYSTALNIKQLKVESEGELAIVLYKQGKIREAVSIFESFAEEYFIKDMVEYAQAVTIGLGLIARLRFQLEGENVPEIMEDGTFYPDFKSRVFTTVLKNVKPNYGQNTAFLILSETYRLLGDKENQINMLRKSFGGKPIISLDSSSKTMAALNLINELTLLGNFEEITDIIKEIFKSTSGKELPQESVWVLYIFTRSEDLLKTGRLSKVDYEELISSIEDGTSVLMGLRKYWWLAEICKRKAGIDGTTPEESYHPAYLRKAWEYAREANNFDVLRDTGHQIGFRYANLAKSIKEVAEIQLSVVLAVCNDSGTHEGKIARIEAVGNNLLTFWSKINYRKMQESDIPYLLNLRDRAKNLLDDNSPKDLLSPLMILLLLSVNKVIFKEEYRMALSWIYSKVWERLDELPIDERKYVKNILENTPVEPEH